MQYCKRCSFLKKLILFITSLCLITVMVSCNIPEKTDSARSSLESQAGLDNSSKEASNETSKTESLTESVAVSEPSPIEESGSVSEESVTMPVGVSVVDEIYYLNLEGGNKFVKPEIPTNYGDYDFPDFESFQSKMKSLDFRESELPYLKLMKQNKYGILFLNADKLYKPVGISKEFTLEVVGYQGFESYSFSFSSKEGKHILFQHQHSDTLESNKEYFAKDMEDIELNPKSKAVKSKETSNGVEKTVLKYEAYSGAAIISSHNPLLNWELHWEYPLHTWLLVVRQQLSPPVKEVKQLHPLR